MSSTAITESNAKTTVIVPYPEGAQVQAELEKWQKALELYAMENKFGPALTDASSRTEYDRMPANIATMAGQAWAAVSKSIKHSKSLELEVEALRAGYPEFYQNGGWLIVQLIERLPLHHPSQDGRQSARYALYDFIRGKLPVHAEQTTVDEYLAEMTTLNMKCGTAEHGMLDEPGLAAALNDAVPYALRDDYERVKTELIRQRRAAGRPAPDYEANLIDVAEAARCLYGNDKMRRSRDASRPTFMPEAPSGAVRANVAACSIADDAEADLLACWCPDLAETAMAARKTTSAATPQKFCTGPGSCTERGKLGRGHTWEECFANPKHADRSRLPPELKTKWDKLPQAAKDGANSALKTNIEVEARNRQSANAAQAQMAAQAQIDSLMSQVETLRTELQAAVGGAKGAGAAISKSAHTGGNSATQTTEMHALSTEATQNGMREIAMPARVGVVPGASL